MSSILKLADSYKYSHASQYPKNTVGMYTYLESRGGLYPSVVFEGLFYYLQKYLSVPITMEDVLEVHDMAKAHGVPFDYRGWKHIVEKHGGFLPITIKAVREGSVVPTQHVLLTVTSNDPLVPWVAGFVETLLLKLWYPITVATKSYHTKKMLEKYGSPEWALFAYHNFGDRGSTSVEAAELGGFAHLTQFMGTDNFNSLFFCKKYYGADIAGFSVFASEHSTTTSWSKDKEEEFVYQQLVANPDAPIMSFVADSYDVFGFTNFCTHPESRIRRLVESRPNQKLVLRPDSGDPFDVLREMLEIMYNNGVFDSNIDGKFLSSNFGILWGDGITPITIEHILKVFTKKYIGEYGLPVESRYPKRLYAAENFVFGSGGDLMQNVTRDTQKFAIKCSSIDLDIMGSDMVERDVFKDPITDPGKKSKRGKVTTFWNPKTKEYKQGLISDKVPEGFEEALIPVFENGKILYCPTLEEIRARSNEY